jgi:hypothetical protein
LDNNDCSSRLPTPEGEKKDKQIRMDLQSVLQHLTTFLKKLRTIKFGEYFLPFNSDPLFTSPVSKMLKRYFCLLLYMLVRLGLPA